MTHQHTQTELYKTVEIWLTLNGISFTEMFEQKSIEIDGADYIELSCIYDEICAEEWGAEVHSVSMPIFERPEHDKHGSAFWTIEIKF
jgi:hypothetical protein